MPDPGELKVGDLIRFISLPEEWNREGHHVHKESVEFMQAMIRRKWPSRIAEIDEHGIPWISARIKRRGRIEHHTWGIFESTGWRKVIRKQ